MKSLYQDPTMTTAGCTDAVTASDVDLSHTIDDDIAFECVRHMPRRTQFVSTHRKLSWQFDRQVKQHERDQRITHVEMARAQIAMAEKLNRLQDAKKEVRRRRSDPDAGLSRGRSAPCLPDIARTEQKDSARMAAIQMKHSHSASSFPLVDVIPEDTELAESAESNGTKEEPETASMENAEVGVTPPIMAGRRATVAVHSSTARFNLPPHLVRRFSQFMDSTSALLRNGASDKTRNNSIKKSVSQKYTSAQLESSKSSEMVSDVQIRTRTAN